jgi:anti-anti-sigma factor
VTLRVPFCPTYDHVYAEPFAKQTRLCARPANGMDMNDPLSATFSCQLRGAVVIVRIAGEIDVANSHHVTDTLSAAAMLAEHRVVVDVSGLSFLDVAATRALRRATSRAFQDGVSIVLAAPSRSLAHLLNQTDPEGSLTVYDSVAEAVKPARTKRRATDHLKPVAPAGGSVLPMPTT